MRILMLLGAVMFALLLARPAEAAQAGAMIETQVAAPFDGEAVTDDVLAQAYGGSETFGFSRNARQFADTQAVGSFQQVGQVNRITLDNWFAREGLDILAAARMGRIP